MMRSASLLLMPSMLHASADECPAGPFKLHNFSYEPNQKGGAGPCVSALSLFPANV